MCVHLLIFVKCSSSQQMEFNFPPCTQQQVTFHTVMTEWQAGQKDSSCSLSFTEQIERKKSMVPQDGLKKKKLTSKNFDLVIQALKQDTGISGKTRMCETRNEEHTD